MSPRQAIASRRAAAETNLGRLLALASAPPGLVVAALAGDTVGVAQRALPPEGAAAAAVADLPGVTLWVWPATTPPEHVGRDLADARAVIGEDTRAVVVLRPKARVLSAPFQGEVGAEVEGIDAVPLIRAVSGLDEGELVRGIDVPWSTEAEARIATAGFTAHAPGD